MNYQIKIGFLISIIYCITVIFFKSNKKINNEFFKIIDYSIWFVVAFTSNLYNKNEYFSMTFVTITMFINFLYELIFITPDLSHSIHHILTIISIFIAFPLKLHRYKIIAQISNIFTIGMFSSIFSALRKILKETQFKESSYQLYKISYLISKIWAIFSHYKVFFDNNKQIIKTSSLKKALLTYSSIHIIQIYFITKILTSYIKN